jgi:hypothetical protein
MKSFYEVNKLFQFQNDVHQLLSYKNNVLILIFRVLQLSYREIIEFIEVWF